MADRNKVVWSAEAIYNLDTIIKYLETHWTEREVTLFLAKISKAIFLISSKPQLFPSSKHRTNLRRCVVTKQITHYYKTESGTLQIVSLFDNRQDPSKL